jgi:hypothetical protein
MADQLTTFTCRLSRNLVASNCWNPQGLSRPVMGLLYLLILLTDITLVDTGMAKAHILLRLIVIDIGYLHTVLNIHIVNMVLETTIRYIAYFEITIGLKYTITQWMLPSRV